MQPNRANALLFVPKALEDLDIVDAIKLANRHTFSQRPVICNEQLGWRAKMELLTPSFNFNKRLSSVTRQRCFFS
ncbi:hypothetical protein K2D_27660 [Planctomycetes bacterium K2D]|uniref:Uncharacterized protein n=1 Tax=Botrimarina mediterranea TaxID=2528022 RepID=A0A518K9P0_9BACT|nr:hypothetical protein Spa11_27190 [Botrimarina mediterranea]QDV79155.1 hypothetical protein K2D_27660 [Planctomycetes bacterium K2D]